MSEGSIVEYRDILIERFVAPGSIMSQADAVTDLIPPQAWLVIPLALAAIGPASYVWRHVTHSASTRDITRPPEDLSWRSDAYLYRSLAVLAGLLAVGVFSFTSAAEDFAKSDAFGPLLLGGLGSFAIGTVIMGWRSGEIGPLIRGHVDSYRRDKQPKRYWASLGWNAFMGCALIVLSLVITNDNFTPRCDDRSDDETRLLAALDVCNAMLAEDGLGDERRVVLLGARGRVHHRLGNDRSALTDYSATLEQDPKNSYALYNRAMIHSRLGNFAQSIDDLNASLSLRPDNDDAYLERGNAYLDAGNYKRAIVDYTTLYDRDRQHPYARANRGIAHAWLGNRELAERDFEGVSKGSPAWPVALRGRAVLARQRSDHKQVVDYMTQALAVDSKDSFALRLRADAYWELGEHELARDDDDRLMEIDPESRKN